MIEKFRALPPSAQGAILMSIALLLFSCMDIISKTLTQHYNPLQVVWARYTSQTVLAFLILAPYLSTLLRTKYFKMQLVRSAFLFGGTLCFFISLKFMPIVTVTAIFEVSPPCSSHSLPSLCCANRSDHVAGSALVLA